jgi:hypothetical protein
LANCISNVNPVAIFAADQHYLTATTYPSRAGTLNPKRSTASHSQRATADYSQRATADYTQRTAAYNTQRSAAYGSSIATAAVEDSTFTFTPSALDHSSSDFSGVFATTAFKPNRPLAASA